MGDNKQALGSTQRFDAWTFQQVLRDTVRRITAGAIGAGAGAFLASLIMTVGIGLLAKPFAALFGVGILARGLIALGNISVGLVAIGNAAFGGLAVGNLAIGLTAIGNAAFGVLLAIGNGAIGSVAIGNGACGLIAIGNGAAGLIAIGQTARGLIAVKIDGKPGSGSAKGRIAIGRVAKGNYVFAWEGEGEHVLEQNRHDEKANPFFSRFIPHLKLAFGQKEEPAEVLTDRLQRFLQRDPRKAMEPDLYGTIQTEENDEIALQRVAAYGDQAVPWLVEWLNSWHPRVRNRAAEALKRIESSMVSQRLEALLNHPKRGLTGWFCWVIGLAVSEEDLVLKIIEIAAARQDARLIEAVLRQYAGRSQQETILLKAAKAYLQITPEPDLTLLLEPFTRLVWATSGAGTKRRLFSWLPPDQDINDFIESTLQAFEQRTKLETIGVLASCIAKIRQFAQTSVNPEFAKQVLSFSRGIAKEYAERKTETSPSLNELIVEGQQDSLQLPAIGYRIRSLMEQIVDTIEPGDEAFLPADQMRAVLSFLNWCPHRGLQRKLILAMAHIGDETAMEALNRLERSAGTPDYLRVAIRETIPRLQVRIEKLKEARLLLRAASESIEATTLLRSAAPPPAIPDEQLPRSNTASDSED